MTWADFAELAQDVPRSVLAEDATYDAPPGGSPVVITGEFDAAAVQIELEGAAAVQTVGPRIVVKLSELPAGEAKVGATVVARGVSYAVLEVEPDGQGLARLRLERV